MQCALNKNSKSVTKSLKKVSSGMKINSAGDDASGMSISEKMRVQIRALEQANTNAQNASSMMQVADGAASSTMDLLKTLKEKAINAANDTNTDADRATIQKELNQSIDQLSDNANVTFNGIKLFTGNADVGNRVEDTIIKALNSDWLHTSLDMIQDAYGLNFIDGRASVNEMDVKFVNLGTGTLAQIKSSALGGITNKLTLEVNMDYYDDLNQKDPDGSMLTRVGGLLDRTIAHEMTHAVMRANIIDMSSMPQYAREGLAEVTHGIDDERVTELRSIKGRVANGLVSSGGGTTTYADGYAFFRYLARQAGPGSDRDALKNFMQTLADKGGNYYDQAISELSGGRFADATAAETQFKSDLANSASSEDFLLNYCGIDLNNPDKGSILGSDAGTGEAMDEHGAVVEGLNTRFWYYPTKNSTMISGLNVVWPDFQRGDMMKFQVGTKANQVITAVLGDISAEGLGLKADDGKVLSVETRVKAKQAIAVLDKAIDKVLDQQTTIGAVSSRMQYTQVNLTAACENTTNAESVIRDTDMAKEMAEYTKSNVLMQAAQSMLVQANQIPQNVLSLLQ